MNVPLVNSWAAERLQCKRLLRALRVDLKMSFVSRGFVKFFLVDGSKDELSDLEHLEAPQFTELAAQLQSSFFVSDRIPNVRVLCFGRRVRTGKMEPGLRTIIEDGFYRGMWLRQFSAVLVKMNDSIPVRRLLLHEVTHALMDLLGNETDKRSGYFSGSTPRTKMK